MMKKVLLFLLLSGFVSGVRAQDKNKTKANEQAEYVAKKMNLNTYKKTFLSDALYRKYSGVKNEVHSKNLSKEQRKEINKKYGNEFNKGLRSQFSKDEIKKIKTSLKEFREQFRKK